MCDGAADRDRYKRYVDLCQRAAACPGWRWYPGMQTLHTRIRVLRVDRNGYAIGATQPDQGWPEIVEVPLDAVPALQDRGTQGCVRQLLHDLWPGRAAWWAPSGLSGWTVYYHVDGEISTQSARTLEEAFVLALESRGEVEPADDGREDGA